MEKITFKTTGDGFWSNEAREVQIINMGIGYVDDDIDFGELRVQFNTKDWDIFEHGLIYTDSQFLKELRRFLHTHGLPGHDVEYSEQGMQGEDYVSLDVGEKFLKAWASKFDIDFNKVLEEQERKFKERWGA